MDEWLTAARDALAAAAGVPAETLTLGADDERALLALARVAAHDSGDRTNAPLLCYLVGRAQGGGSSVADLAGAVTRSSS